VLRRRPRPGAVDVGPADRLLREGRTLANFGETEVLVVRTRRGIFGVENRCPHMGRRLSDAAISGRKVVCMGHHGRYDLDSGEPAGRFVSRVARLPTFDAAIVDGRLWLSPKCSI
jgi:nitrite reductase/ring-hydroxylating ferredoxin subunit